MSTMLFQGIFRQAETGSYIFYENKKERIGRILLMHANHREDTDMVFAGDIAAAVGLKDTSTGDTLCSEDAPVILESMEFPEPVIHIAVEPKTKAGQEKMVAALAKLAEEDPTFKARMDPDTGQTVISGWGIAWNLVDRMMREFKVEANVGSRSVHETTEAVRRKASL